LFGDPHTTLIRNAIRTRYTYLPYVYTLFREASLTGTPVMRPLWVEFPHDEESFHLEDQWLLGSDLLIKPVTERDQRSTTVYLPGQTTRWYEVGSWSSYPGQYSVTVNTPLEKIPVFQRGGSIIVKRERARRNSALMENDPFTLVLALDGEGKAEGTLYLDDGHTFNYAKGEYIFRKFSFANNILTSTKGDSSQNSYTNSNTIERIVVVGIAAVTKAVLKVPNRSPVELSISQTPISSTSSSSLTRLTVRKPDTLISSDWSIEFS
jgi:alpha 1,3-glucosidase